ITKNTGELPWRTTSPHETLAAARAARPRSRVALRISPCRSVFDDARRNEDQEFGVRIAEVVTLEQPFEQRNLAEPRRAVGAHGTRARIDSANDGCLAIAHKQRC